MKTQLITILILLISYIQTSAQGKNDSRRTNWELSFSSGYSFGGPANDLDEFLNNSGYNWELSPINYLPVNIDLTRTINSSLTAGISFFTYKQDLIWDNYGWYNSKFNTFVINPYLSYNYKELLFINAGPSINRISYFHPTGTSLEDDEIHLKAGMTFNSIVKLPKKTRLYILFEVMYNYGGKISPFYHIENRNRQYTYTTLHAENLPVDFYSFGIGFGIRSFKKPDK